MRYLISTVIRLIRNIKLQKLPFTTTVVGDVGEAAGDVGEVNIIFAGGVFQTPDDGSERSLIFSGVLNFVSSIGIFFSGVSSFVSSFEIFFFDILTKCKCYKFNS